MRIPLRIRVLTRWHRARRRLRDVTFGTPDALTVREDLARRYLRGSGLEIGALHRPLRVPPAVRVRYVDRASVADLRARYTDLADRWMVEADVLDDAAVLASVPDASQDFVIANHVLEHMEDPVGALRTWLRVLKPGGVAYLAVPDKRRSFDGLRPSTSIDHVLRDHREGPDWSRSAHYEEYARLAERVPEAEVLTRAGTLEAERADIHFHVWSQPELIALLLHLREHEGFPLELELVQANDIESLLILRRAP